MLLIVSGIRKAIEPALGDVWGKIPKFARVFLYSLVAVINNRNQEMRPIHHPEHQNPTIFTSDSLFFLPIPIMQSCFFIFFSTKIYILPSSIVPLFFYHTYFLKDNHPQRNIFFVFVFKSYCKVNNIISCHYGINAGLLNSIFM